jgi:hypothetical protein
MRAVLILFVAALLWVPTVTRAQSIPEIRPFVGAFVPTGAQRDDFNDALLVGTQLALETSDRFHVVGTFAFTGPDFNNPTQNSGHMHIYQVDIGGELFRNVDFSSDWKFRPFLGVGAGVRRYDPTETGDSKNYPAGYGALGAEFQLNQFALRFETRDYLTQFKGVTGNESTSTRNEVVFSAGLALHLR